MGWDDIEIDKLIKTNRKKLEELIDKNAPKIPLFINPTASTPVETSEFLSHLRLEFLDPFLKKIFPRFERIKEKVYARIRLLLFMKLRGIKFISTAYRIIQTNEIIAENLGFDFDNLPTYETIRHFINDLLPNELDTMFYSIVKEIDRNLRKNGDKISKASEDATVITAKRNDDAKYSGYYKTKGWKKDLLRDSHGIFISYEDMEINDNEGDALLHHLQKLREIGIKLEELTVDGKYPTYENIAIAKCGYGTNLLYKPQKHWVYNEKGSVRKLHERYSRYWRDEYYKANQSIDYELQFLYKKGEYEYVGAYFRNIQVKKYEVNEKLRKKIIRKRNGDEGFNSYIKQHVGFESDLPRKGRKNAFFHTTLCLVTLNMVALTRLQNGIKENLTSVAYLV